MSLLVDYSSSSEDEAPLHVATTTAPAAAPSSAPSIALPAAAAGAVEPSKPATKKATKKKKTAKKTKTTLHLPPEIQRLLESGTLGDSDDDDDDGDSLLAKQKRAAAKRPRTATASTASTASRSCEATTLSFLPAPKHHIEPKPTPPMSIASVNSERQEQAEDTGVDQTASDPSHNAAAYQQSEDPAHHHQQYYDPQQYAQYYAQSYQQQQQQGFALPQDEQPAASKRARHRDRELERMLQMGQFSAVADKIVEVAAPAPDAWQAPPVEQLQKGSASELKVKASFWNSSAGTAVASVKPSRLQRQKHQLNQLAFDAKAREFELLDRKGAGIKTKRETHAKYGW